jgi:ABC-type glycerol-3-phosphate transport system substrate-binding protein
VVILFFRLLLLKKEEIMKKFMVVLAVVILALVFTIGILITGCKKSSGPVTLTIWGRDVLDTQADHMYVTSLIKDFQAANPDIKVDYVNLGNGLNDKIKVAMSAESELPDIIQSWGGRMMGDFADHDKLLDLTKELKGINCSNAAKEAMTWKGKIYGVAPFFAIAGVFQNDSIFEKYGLSTATTIEELEKNAEVLLKNGIQPFAAGGKDKWPVLHTYMYLVDRVGGPDAFSDAVSRKTHFYNDAFVEAANLLRGWIKKGYFGKKPLGESYDDSQLLMASGKAAMQLTGSWMCANYSSADFTKEKLSIHSFPAFASGGKGSDTEVMGMTDIGWAATKEAADNKGAVVKFMKFAMSKEACEKEPGRVCSVPGVEAKNSLTTQASEIFSKATYVEFWWDQNLPAAATTPVNDVVQVIFLPNGDYEKALKDFDKLMDTEVGPVK